MSWVFADAPKDLKPAEMLVAISLANHASSDGGHAYPSVQAMMDETRLSRRSVQSSLRTLEERGVIEVEREATRRLPAMYAFCAFRGANTASDDGSGAQSVQGGAQILPVRGAEIAPKPSVVTVSEPSGSPLYPPKSTRDGRKTRWREEWAMPDEWREYAVSAGEDAEVQFDKFRLHWLGTGKSMADWKATWQRWIRQAPDFRWNGKPASTSRPEGGWNSAGQRNPDGSLRYVG
jgi:hypothetical protein